MALRIGWGSSLWLHPVDLSPDPRILSLTYGLQIHHAGVDLQLARDFGIHPVQQYYRKSENTLNVWKNPRRLTPKSETSRMTEARCCYHDEYRLQIREYHPRSWQDGCTAIDPLKTHELIGRRVHQAAQTVVLCGPSAFIYQTNVVISLFFVSTLHMMDLHLNYGLPVFLSSPITIIAHDEPPPKSVDPRPKLW